MTTPQRPPLEELAFSSAALDGTMQEAGFVPLLVDPDASRDLSFRARYMRTKGALFPRLQASLEYYLANRSYSLRISADVSDKDQERTFYLLVKNYKGDLKELLDNYFDSVRRGVPLLFGEEKR